MVNSRVGQGEDMTAGRLELRAYLALTETDWRRGTEEGLDGAATMDWNKCPSYPRVLPQVGVKRELDALELS